VAEELVRTRVEGGTAVLTLDSPSNRNALSRRLVAQLLEGLATAEDDTAVKVVVIGAAGGTFCAGADLAEARTDGMAAAARTLVDLQRRIVALSKPVVARVHGNVRAGGIGVVAACDIAVSAEDATYAFTEVRLGLAPAAISLTVLPRLTDRAAADAFLTGRTFDGTTAARMGLVTRAVPEEDLDAAVAQTCAALTEGSSQGLRETKRLLNRGLLQRIDEQGSELAQLSARLFGSPEARAAMLAFLDRSR
jgi:enoyl-CoA hydratase/methylglutaconyl-CoA hydratase